MTWTLANTASVMGGAVILLHLPALVLPALCCRGITAFPRNEWAGWILTAVALTWSTLILLQSWWFPESLKSALYVVAPVAFMLIVAYLDELLAPRALGGLLLLIGEPILNVTRWHDSSFRFVVTVLVYVSVVAGIILVLNPYRFRQVMAFWVRDSDRCRIGGAIGVLVGGILILLGLKVY